MMHVLGGIPQEGRPPDEENGRPLDPQGGNPAGGTAVQSEDPVKASTRQRSGPRALFNTISKFLTRTRVSLDWLATLAHLFREASAWVQELK